MKTIHTAGLICIRNNQLLLAFSIHKKAWYLPGGKSDAGETSLQTIHREIKEELNIELASTRLRFYRHISAPAYGEHDTLMEQDCFLYNLQEKIIPANEIAAISYFNYENYLQEPIQVPGVLQVFSHLKDDKLII